MTFKIELRAKMSILIPTLAVKFDVERCRMFQRVRERREASGVVWLSNLIHRPVEPARVSMSVVLPALAVASAAFCVWLTVQSVNRQERQSSIFSTAVLVLRKVMICALLTLWAVLATILFGITVSAAHSDPNWYLNSPLIAVMGIPAMRSQSGALSAG